jgi:hypothetical protein
MPYLQFAHEGDASAVSPNAQFWVASLSEGGHTTSLYAKSKERRSKSGRVRSSPPAASPS